MVTAAQSGVEVGRTLERAVGRVRRQLDEHVVNLTALDQQVSDLVARRGGALLDLARHYLPDMTRETVERTFAEVRDDLREILARKQRRERELQDQLAAAERSADEQEAELGRVTELLNAKVAEREKLEALVAERLHGSDEFKRLSEQAIAAETELERNEERVAESKTEAAKKLPSYERSRLFKYLYDAGYGTSRYQGKGLTRRIDGWVARMIDYPAARRGYDFLRVTPELMEKEVSRRRDEFNELMSQVELIEDRVSDEVGLTDVMRAGQELGAQRDRAVSTVAKAQDEALGLQKSLAALAGSQNEFYAQGLARMQNFLGNLPPGRLESQSRSTPEREDDAIVAEVSFLQGQLNDADQRSALLARDRAAWDERLGGLQSVLQRFRKAEFDSRRSQFVRELDADELTERFIAGQLGAAEMWSRLEGAQHFTPEWHERPSHGRGSESSGGPIQIDMGDVSNVLMHVLVEVAGAAMRGAATRGVERRAPTRSQRRISSGRPPFPKRGFTNGRGF